MATHDDWPVFVSFYTDAYERLADNLREGLVRYGLPYRIQRREDQGSWVQNCAYKPKYLWQMLNAYPDRAIVWLDADAELLASPDVFRGRLECDVAVHYHRRPNRNRSLEVLSGTVYLAPTYKARLLVDRWVEECEMHPGTWDQRALQRALGGVEGLDVLDLPVEYVFIHDTHREQYPKKQPVILHRQHSRVVRRRKQRAP